MIGAREALELLIVLLRRGLGARGEVVQEIHHLGHGLGHARLQRILGVAREPEQARGLPAQSENPRHEPVVVPPARVRTLIARARDVGRVHLPAQIAVIGMGHEGDVRRPFEREAPAFEVLFPRRLARHRARGLGQPGEVFVVGNAQVPGLGGVEHVVRELARERRELLLNLLEPRLLVRRQLGAGEAKIAYGVRDDLLLRRRKPGELRARGDALVARIQALVLGDLRVVLGELRDVLVVDRAQRVVVHDGVQVRHRRPHARETFVHVLERLGEARPGIFAPGDDPFPERAVLGQNMVERGPHVLRPDGAEARQASQSMQVSST